MSLRVPVTATDMREWVRLAANAINGALTRIASLETYSSATFTFAPGPLPASPTEGMVAMDSSDHKLKVWDGTTWQALF